MNKLVTMKLNDRDKKSVRVAILDGTPWWFAEDVCEILKLTSDPVGLGAALEEDQTSYVTVEFATHTQDFFVISRAALTTLYFLSRTTEAQYFQRWFTVKYHPEHQDNGGPWIGLREPSMFQRVKDFSSKHRKAPDIEV